MDLGSNTPNEDWVALAISNQVYEADYTRKGGNVLDVERKNNADFNITTVVDIMVGDNILGKDYLRKLTITPEDIVALDAVDTMNQAAEVYLQVTKGSVPEFPYIGVTKGVVGSPRSVLKLASISREVSNNFKTDDSFRSIEMVDNGINQDVAFYDFKIVSRLNHELNKTL